MVIAKVARVANAHTLPKLPWRSSPKARRLNGPVMSTPKHKKRRHTQGSASDSGHEERGLARRGDTRISYRRMQDEFPLPSSLDGACPQLKAGSEARTDPIRYLAIPGKPHRSFLTSLRYRNRWEAEWHAVPDISPKASETLCGLPTMAEAHRTWDLAMCSFRCPKCKMLVEVASRTREITLMAELQQYEH